ncbi:MAG: hybrid sensor histidine kinase/response regulator [Desulfobacterales bacterium]|nr:hybrid sensor histidine kinase/response regulator [Desulfobacterales bacterium]
MINKESPPEILIVDDDPTTFSIIEGYLQPSNYYVHFADNGKNALKTVKKVRPDLILLDIMMPGMSGFEVCEILKNDEATRDIPVLFITSLSDRDAHKKAIECGGEGFIVKPFNEGLIRAYVKTFIRTKKIHDDVKQRLASNTDFTSMTIHDLNNLDFAVSANLELAMLDCIQSPRANRYLTNAQHGLEKANKMIEQLQAIMHAESSREDLDFTPINVIDLIDDAARPLEAQMESKDLRFHMQESDFVEIQGNKDLLLRVLANLIGNAVKFAWPGTQIGVECLGAGSRWMEVIISNQCDPIPEQYHDLVFEKFKKVPNGKKREAGIGLGLAFSRSAIESHGGRIWLESPLSGQESGVAVHFTLPSME